MNRKPIPERRVAPLQFFQMRDLPFRRWSDELRAHYGTRVHKISLDLGAGCPHRRNLTTGGCIFCDARGGGSGAFLLGEGLEDQILRGIHVLRQRFRAERAVLYFQSYSSTHLPLTELDASVRTALALAQSYVTVVGIAVGARPDGLPKRMMQWLQSLTHEGLAVWVELGVQTTDPEGLLWLRRGHDLSAVEDVLDRLRSVPEVTPVAHLIAGIPGEAEGQLAQSVMWLGSRGVRHIKFHPLHVLRGTPLEGLYRQGRFIPLSLEGYGQRLLPALRALPGELVVQRFSADARPPYLVAPEWVAEKGAVERFLETALTPAVKASSEIGERPS